MTQFVTTFRQIYQNIVKYSFLLHFLGLCHHTWVCSGFVTLDLDAHQDPIIISLKPFKFLTISGWCFGFQTTHLVLSLMVRWQHWRGKNGNKKIMEFYTKTKDIFFRGIVFPLTVQMCGLFWTLFTIDRDLVFPQAWDAVIPTWMNHGVHTMTLVLVILELPMTRVPGDKKIEEVLYWSLSVGYSFLLNTVYIINNTWIYPFLGLFTWTQLLVFQALFCCFGRLLLQIVWNIDSGRLKEGKNV